MQINGNAFQSAQLGISRGMQQLNSAATSIASNTGKSEDLTASLIGLIESRQQVKSSVKVMEHANRAFDSLLTIKA